MEGHWGDPMEGHWGGLKVGRSVDQRAAPMEDRWEGLMVDHLESLMEVRLVARKVDHLEDLMEVQTVTVEGLLLFERLVLLDQVQVVQQVVRGEAM